MILKTPPRIVKSSFVKGATNKSHFPTEDLPEIAVAGRSNVGKSSLLRFLLNNRKLVRVSQTPGRTREVNFFSIETKEFQPFLMADLPGYGYAKVPVSMRKEWGVYITNYLYNREQLKLVILLVDARRGIQDAEVSFVNWLKEIKQPFIVVLTKIDKLPKTKWGNEQKKVFNKIFIKPLVFSSIKKLGVNELWQKISPYLMPAENNK
jgi:GTP-binding protein